MADRIISANDTLVKYNDPVLVVDDEDQDSLDTDPVGPTAETCFGSPLSNQEGVGLLNSIFPPKEWETDGQRWRQVISTTQSTRFDVKNLEEQLNLRLQQRQARQIGICAIRIELYGQCFDELIRQILLNCAERGLMLSRVRDEFRMTLDAYQILYSSSITFGMRKAIQAEQEKEDYEHIVKELQETKQDLEKQVLELRSRVEQIERREEERRDAEEKKYNEEVQFLKKTSQQLKAQLDGIVLPKK